MREIQANNSSGVQNWEDTFVSSISELIPSVFGAPSVLRTKAGVLNVGDNRGGLYQQMRVFAILGVMLQTVQRSVANELRHQRRINGGHFQAMAPGDQHQRTLGRRRNGCGDYVPVQAAGDESAQLLDAQRIRARMVEHHDGAVFDVVQPSLDGHVGVFAVARPNRAMVAAGSIINTELFSYRYLEIASSLQCWNFGDTVRNRFADAAMKRPICCRYGGREQNRPYAGVGFIIVSIFNASKNSVIGWIGRVEVNGKIVLEVE